jgi:glyoxylate/hydroxypyruvate reductase
MAPAKDNPEHRPAHSRTGSVASNHLNVLVNLPLEPEFVRRIESVDPRIRVSRSMAPPEGGDVSPDASWRSLEGAELDAVLAPAHVILSFGFPVEWLSKAPDLKWAQLASAGSDHMLRQGILQERPDLVLTTASGVHAVQISEHILAMILHFSRGFDRTTRNQQIRKWERLRLDEAMGKTVCFVGYGHIARRAATLCQALGMRVLCVRASIAEQQPGFEAVERFYPVEELNDVLSESDFVVVAAPHTARSEGMIGAQQLAAMKPSAVLVNISRGALVDEPALVKALQDSIIAGAGLDVFVEEPLPESSPLWDLPNVLITPHISGTTPHYSSRITDLFCDNLVRYLRGEPLVNLVIGERGY